MSQARRNALSFYFIFKRGYFEGNVQQTAEYGGFGIR